MCKIVDALLADGRITRGQLSDAEQKRIGAKKPLQELLVEMGFVREEQLMATTSRVLGMPVADLKIETVEPEALSKIPYTAAKRHGAFPLRRENGHLVVAMSNPQDLVAVDDLTIMCGVQVRPVLARKSDIAAKIDQYYQISDALYDLFKNVVNGAKVEAVGEDSADVRVLTGDRSPAVKLVNLLLADSLRSRASDVHIEPQQDFIEVRYRVDGRLKSIMKLPLALKANIPARIKVLAGLDVAESRKPQDGRVEMTIDERPVDLRISTVPTYYGEKVVMRLLDKKRGGIDLEGIVTDVGDREALLAASNAKQGMVLVTGPTGSGKTTTLYGLLGAVKSESKNIVTLEDPVEYLMEGINQIQVNPLKNVTFATGLRSILRQDPNVILVGEIRDRETADAAFRAAQTGHLVFSTLHTKSTTATIARLMDIGLEPYQIATSLTMVVAQRLLRRICPKCKEEHIPDHIPVGAGAAAKFYRGKGCADCDYTGYQGRFAVQEMLHLDDGLRGLIARKASEEELAAAAQERGMRTLGELALAAAAAGRTTLEEAAELMDAAVPAEQSPPPATPDPDRKPRILAVDDEADILTVLSARLRQAGYEVLQARNGKEAVEAAVREKPDLLVMDVMMPEMDGFEATRVLRSRLQTAGIPIMLLTAMQGKEGELTGLDAGADDYVNKPFDKEKLLARVKMLLRRRLI